MCIYIYLSIYIRGAKPTKPLNASFRALYGVRWRHPNFSKKDNFKPRHKNAVLDLFGPWTWADLQPLEELQQLPDA